MRHLVIILVIALVSGLSSGCFVFDELNTGIEIMDQHSGKKKPEAKTDEGGSGASSFLSGVDATGKLQKFQEKIDEAMAEPPDPNNTLVGCEVEGRVRYTRKYDCQALGGRLVMR